MSRPAPSHLRTRYAGLLHMLMAPVALVATGALLFEADGLRWHLSVGLYGISMTAMLAGSAMYHRVPWSETGRRRMRQIDRSTIFVFIAASATPLIAFSDQDWLLVPLWVAAAGGVAFNVAWPAAPKWISVVAFIGVGSFGGIALPGVGDQLGTSAVILVLAMGVLYLIGALVYAFERPDPMPETFGYHDIFHAFVVAAAVAGYVNVAVNVLPAAS